MSDSRFLESLLRPYQLAALAEAPKSNMVILAGNPKHTFVDVFALPPRLKGPVNVVWDSPPCAHFSRPAKTSAFRRNGPRSFKIRLGRVGKNDVGSWATVAGWHDAYLTFLNPRFPVDPPGAENCRWKVIHPKAGEE